jgi:hypothetical protein
MISVNFLFGKQELTVDSAVRWLGQEGFGRPYVLTHIQRSALPRFLASRSTTYGFLQRESFVSALQQFASPNGMFDRDDPRKSKRILFVGAIDGKAELQFLLDFHWRGNAVITSYEEMLDALETLPDRLPHAMQSRLRTRGHIDATKLGMAFPVERFDFVVWIGPTNDSSLANTAALVDAFVTSAASVLNQDGAVIVIQDMKNPTFRKILELEGANFYSAVQIEGRTQTQHSDAIVRLTGREDHMVAFFFGTDKRRIVDDEQSKSDKAKGIRVLGSILSAKDIPVPPHSDLAKAKPREKKYDLVNKIFEYAKSVG